MENRKKTILVVDDTEINIDILVELLGDDYDILVALSGERAIKIATKKEIDLILLDIMMPDMDGYETCEVLKASEDTKGIPIIFITAKSEEDSINRAYEVGGADYVTKPFKIKELQARVNTQLDMQQLISELEVLKEKLRDSTR